MPIHLNIIGPLHEPESRHPIPCQASCLRYCFSGCHAVPWGCLRQRLGSNLPQSALLSRPRMVYGPNLLGHGIVLCLLCSFRNASGRQRVSMLAPLQRSSRVPTQMAIFERRPNPSINETVSKRGLPVPSSLTSSTAVPSKCCTTHTLNASDSVGLPREGPSLRAKSQESDLSLGLWKNVTLQPSAMSVQCNFKPRMDLN